MFEEREHAIADEVHRGLVAGNEEQKDHREKFILGELVTRFLGFHQSTNKIVFRTRPALFNDLANVGEESESGRNYGNSLPRCRDASHRIGPTVKLVAVIDRHSEQLRNDRSWQGESEIADHIHAAVLLNFVEQLVCKNLNSRAKLFNQTRCECFVYQRSQSSVIRWIQVEHVFFKRPVNSQLTKPTIESGLPRRDDI